LGFRNRITDRYEPLYSGQSIGGREESFGKKYGWYQSIYAAAQGDLLRFDKVTRLPIHQFLTWLMFEKEKTELELSKIKK
jgi:hypothetical protein